MPVSTATTVQLQYEFFLGRNPTQAESAYWVNAFQAGTATASSLDKVLVNTSDGQALLPEAINHFYQLDVGRAASSAELTYWSGQLQSGAIDLAGMQSTFAALPGAEAHSERTVTEYYQTILGLVVSPQYAGADATNFQVTLYQGARNVAAFSGSITDNIHHAVSALYDTYVARGPTYQELTYWTDALSQGKVLTSDLISALAGTAFGQAHIGTSVSLLYETDLGREPSADELTYWKGQVQGGETLDQLNDLLQSISTAGNVFHQDNGSTPDTITYFSNHVVIDHFKPAQDGINFRMADHPGFDALSHAVQTIGPDNMADVLISLNPYDTVLLHDVQLSQLSASNFHLI